MHENVVIQMHVLIQRVDSYLLDLDAVQEKLAGRLIGPERWQPPDGCCLKNSFDTTFHAPSRTSYTEVVIRNRQGTVLGSRTVVS